MGHYNGNSKHALGDAGYPEVYQDFKKHCSNDRVNTDLAVTVSIRGRHPDAHVTTISSYECDLLGWADAGHQETRLHTEGDNFLAKRTYAPPATRLEEGEGSLGEKVSFGFYDGTYDGHEFNFYEASWRDEFFGRVTKNYYILSPKTSVDAKGHSAWVDSLILAASKWTSELHNEVYVFDSGEWDKNKTLWKAVQSSSWDDVIMDPATKDTLISDVQNFFDSRSVYEEYAVPWKRGIIFHGTPGCGKTISIKALMNALDKRSQPVASLYVKTFTTRCPGEEYSIRDIFQKARVMAPCMLVFEDLDSLVKDKIRSYFLNEVDGLEDNNGILMVGSTNHLERLDPGISKRPSRFDRKYHFKMPAYEERILYCEYWKKKLEKNSKIDFDPAICDVVAKLTEGFSFAYMKELFVQTLLTIVGGREQELDQSETAEAAKVASGSTSLVVGQGKVETGMDETSDKQAAPSAEKKPDQSTKKTEPKPAMPSVEIPSDLQSNSLMRILQKQCAALWKDMDNSTDPEAGQKPTAEPEEESEGDPNHECARCG